MHSNRPGRMGYANRTAKALRVMAMETIAAALNLRHTARNLRQTAVFRRTLRAASACPASRAHADPPPRITNRVARLARGLAGDGLLLSGEDGILRPIDQRGRTISR